MRHNETTAAEEYTRRVLPQLGGLYCAAHAMTGSRENAEVLLCTALSDYFAMNDVLSARASLRSGILREMKNRALSMRQEEKRAPETDFSGLTIPRDAQGRPEKHAASRQPDPASRADAAAADPEIRLSALRARHRAAS